MMIIQQTAKVYNDGKIFEVVREYDEVDDSDNDITPDTILIFINEISRIELVSDVSVLKVENLLQRIKDLEDEVEIIKNR